MKENNLRLGVNIDHIATVRNARKGDFPCLIRALKILKSTNVDSVTVHLREDRRHINDNDLKNLKEINLLPINLEMAATKEMQEICVNLKPFACCIVPEKRKELTTEGGLDVKNQIKYLKDILKPILASNIRVSLFVDPDVEQILAAKKLNVNAVEIHTGRYADAFKRNKFLDELEKIKISVNYCKSLGLECHAGHALDLKNVSKIANIQGLKELNIGHYIVSESIYSGLSNTIKKLKETIELASK